MLMKEKYEIKFFLNLHRVLNEKFELGCEIIDEFDINLKDVDETYIQFIDTKNRDMYTQGLILRNRIKREENACELTYKKRYEIVKDDIQGALEIWSMAECKEPIVEISLEKFKSDEKDEANQYYNELKELLSTKVNEGWTLKEKFSKTDWVMKKCR
ncbi:hypothetical protein G9298_28235 (plasmid) [Bacillus thuringiensis]|nr:hypothetical protein G9298_28235 [Bacillus thuringiensis]